MVSANWLICPQIIESSLYSDCRAGFVFQMILYNSKEMAFKCSQTCTDHTINSSASSYILIKVIKLIKILLIGS
jgi:hypothetical protein